MMKTCPRCGFEFEATHENCLYCDPCREIVRREQLRHNGRHYRERQRQKEVDTTESKPTKTLDDWCREAAECGLDYGNYRALIERHGKTFEELKAQNHRPQCHSHCRIHKTI